MPNKWYYARNGEKVAGPCSSVELKRLASAGHLKPDDLVGRNRIVRLVKAGSVKGLFTANAS